MSPPTSVAMTNVVDRPCSRSNSTFLGSSAHRGFAEATRAETLDEAAIRAKSTAVANAMADEAILRANVRGEVVAILTAEQQEQLKQRQQERGTRRKQGAQR